MQARAESVKSHEVVKHWICVPDKQPNKQNQHELHCQTRTPVDRVTLLAQHRGIAFPKTSSTDGSWAKQTDQHGGNLPALTVTLLHVGMVLLDRR